MMHRILAGLASDEPLYVSSDIDVVDPAIAGATGTSHVGGSEWVERLLR
jgi:arginase family enzyme